MTAAPLEHVGPWNEEEVARRLTNALEQAADRVVTMQLYALAGIRWYLLAQVEPVEHAVAAKGEALRLTEPFPAALDTTLLTR